MITSIQHFCENGVKRLTNVFKTYTDDLTKIAEMVYGVTDEVTRLGCSMIAEEWESYEELLRERKDLRQGWYIVSDGAGASCQDNRRCRSENSTGSIREQLSKRRCQCQHKR